MTIQEIIKKFRIDSVSVNSEGKEGFMFYGKASAAEIAELKEKKEEIVNYLKAKEAAEKLEREEREKATVTFMIIGWESHEVSVDTRYDIDEQLKKIAEYYSNDTTYEAVKEAYENTLIKNAEKEAKRAENKAKENAIFAEAKVTGEKQILTSYMDDCDGSVVECSTDYVTVYAMPDGSTTRTRTHTF